MSDGVVHISEAANLALHTMILIAGDTTRPLRVNQAVEVLPVSDHHLAKVLQRLAHAGLVTSMRGPQGGFKLARPAEEITLLEIFEAIEGTLTVHACLLGQPKCLGHCVLGDFVVGANEDFRAKMQRTKLSDVAGALKRSDTA